VLNELTNGQAFDVFGDEEWAVVGGRTGIDDGRDVGVFEAGNLFAAGFESGPSRVGVVGLLEADAEGNVAVGSALGSLVRDGSLVAIQQMADFVSGNRQVRRGRGFTGTNVGAGSGVWTGGHCAHRIHPVAEGQKVTVCEGRHIVVYPTAGGKRVARCFVGEFFSGC